MRRDSLEGPRQRPPGRRGPQTQRRQPQGIGVVEEVIPEPLGGAHNDPAAAAAALADAFSRHLAELLAKPIEQLLDERYARYRELGEYREVAVR
jgi:acetyl-CoA carboxylase alpha subunit